MYSLPETNWKSGRAARATVTTSIMYCQSRLDSISPANSGSLPSSSTTDLLANSTSLISAGELSTKNGSPPAWPMAVKCSTSIDCGGVQ